MDNQNILTQGNDDVKTYVLEGETVESQLQGFVERSSQTADEQQLNDLKVRMQDIISLVKTVSPTQVELDNLSSFSDPVKSVVSILSGKRNAIDDFFNTLNLCVVGLGSKLRGNL